MHPLVKIQVLIALVGDTQNADFFHKLAHTHMLADNHHTLAHKVTTHPLPRPQVTFVEQDWHYFHAHPRG